MNDEPEYLADGVYAQFENDCVLLQVDDDDDTIELTKEAALALVKYIKGAYELEDK